MIIDLGILPFDMDTGLVEKEFKINSLRYLSLSPMPSSFIKMEELIYEKYNEKISLREVISRIIKSIKVIKTGNEYQVMIEKGTLEKIALLITHGSLSIKGSDVLMNIFNYAKSQL